MKKIIAALARNEKEKGIKSYCDDREELLKISTGNPVEYDEINLKDFEVYKKERLKSFGDMSLSPDEIASFKLQFYLSLPSSMK